MPRKDCVPHYQGRRENVLLRNVSFIRSSLYQILELRTIRLQSRKHNVVPRLFPSIKLTTIGSRPRISKFTGRTTRFCTLTFKASFLFFSSFCSKNPRLRCSPRKSSPAGLMKDREPSFSAHSRASLLPKLLGSGRTSPSSHLKTSK